MIEFNQPYYPTTGSAFIGKALQTGSLFRGEYYHHCVRFFQQQFGFRHIIPTHSCTTALELSARLMDIQPGDEVIVPSYTYISTANAFASFGATIVLADSLPDDPNVDPAHIARLITPRTKAVVVVHYGGFASRVQEVKALLKDRNIFLVEDAAHCIGSKSGNDWLGSYGDFSAFSFHETKNITCGQGGALVINNEAYLDRALILKENGTDHDLFLRGQTEKYVWLDIGSTYNLPELSSSMLYAGLLELEAVSEKRRGLWTRYHEGLSQIGHHRLPDGNHSGTGNGHIFYLLADSEPDRKRLSQFLLDRRIKTAPHYIGLHLTPCYQQRYGMVTLPHSAGFTERLLRLPLHYGLSEAQQDEVIGAIREFYGGAA